MKHFVHLSLVPKLD